MMRLALALAGWVLATAAVAQVGDPCPVADGALQPGFPLAQVQTAIANKKLDIVVLGTTSSALSGSGGTSKSYPARFESELKAKLPGVAVRVVTSAKPRQTAPEMEKELVRILAGDKPGLIVWQTGTGDAIRAIDPDAFRDALDEGVAAVRAAGTDIVLMNMQYSPRTETMIAVAPYLDVMRFVALQNEINLFDRFAIMKYWSEVGAFDLSAPTKKTDLGERVHGCLGRLLAEFVLEAAKLTVSDGKSAR